MKKYIIAFVTLTLVVFAPGVSRASYHFADYQGRPPFHIYGQTASVPAGLTPAQIKQAYNLPASGGSGTIALIDAYANPGLEKDLQVFDTAFGLKACTIANGCLEEHPMSSTIKTDSGWATEVALDVEWAHAIAPNAKILLVEATTPSGTNLLNAVDYARTRKDVVAVSMSWGGGEFPEETSMDSHFISASGATFFASSGDDGTGASWPASSPNVVGVGGTSLRLNSKTHAFVSETAWSGSGGGVSAYEKQPAFQSSYSIPRANGKRAVPDVAYAADPQFGFSVYHASGNSTKGWYVVGGTSAGAPQWAAIKALGKSASNAKFYTDKAAVNATHYFRDIISGSNGTCTYFCTARKHYDYITGLGSPLTTVF